MDTNFFANHAYVLLALAMVFGAFGGMVLMACLTLASRADDALESEGVACCSHDCNQGRDCPVRGGA